jgi:ATP-dependent RNA helicase RhlB
MKFTELDLHEKLMKGINDAGYVECMPIQEESLLHTLKGRDIEAQSQTGTGKTAAFLITIFQHFLDENSPITNKKALIIAPTRELAVQIDKEAKVLGRHLDVTIGCFYGGVGYQQQEKLLEKDVDIIIGTPGRLLDFNQKGRLDFRKLGFLVLDEADRMLDMGFLPDIRRILRRMDSDVKRQIMLFSATLDVETKSIAREFMNDPVSVAIEPEQVTVDKITQIIYHVSENEKMSLMLGILKKDLPKNALIFTNMKHTAAQVAKHLEYNGYKCQYLSGDLPQSKRLRVINNFKSGKLSYLIATDVAARGLHIDDLEMIINYDLPGDCENYVHRIGRTARAGKSGKAISLGCENYIYNLEAIEEFLGIRIPVGIPDEDMFHEDKGAGIDFRREIRGSSTSRSSRSTRPKEKFARKKSPASRPKKASGKKTADSEEKKTKSSDRYSAKDKSRSKDQTKGKDFSKGKSQSKSKDFKEKDQSKRKEHVKGKGKGREKAAGSTHSKEQGERKYTDKKKGSRNKSKVKVERANTSISTFEDRLAYYNSKYGENFKASDAANFIPQKKTFVQKIKGIFSRKKN